MPISPREFEQGEPDPPRAALEELFRSKPEVSFNFDELRVFLRNNRVSVSKRKMREILAVLEEKGWIVSKPIGDVVYYIRRPLGFRK